MIKISFRNFTSIHLHQCPMELGMFVVHYQTNGLEILCLCLTKHLHQRVRDLFEPELIAQ